MAEINNGKGLAILGRYGLIGVMLGLLALTAFCVGIIYRISTNHIEHSTEQAQAFTEASIEHSTEQAQAFTEASIEQAKAVNNLSGSIDLLSDRLK